MVGNGGGFRVGIGGTYPPGTYAGGSSGKGRARGGGGTGRVGIGGVGRGSMTNDDDDDQGSWESLGLNELNESHEL